MFSWFIYSKLERYVRKIIPACAVTKIRGRFPEETGIYKNFEDDNNEDGMSEIVEAWECTGDVEEE